jgi:hypothetical protein
VAELTNAEKLNLAYKLAFLIQGTSNTDDAAGRAWYEEEFPWAPLLISTDVFIETVPWADVGEGNAKQAANPSIISKVDLRLTKKTGYNERLWVPHTTYNDESSSILDNFLIPVKFGPGYTIRLYQDDGSGNKGSEITTTEGAWIFSYKPGLLILGEGHTAAAEGWQEPLHLVGYRYIGNTVASITGSSIDLDGAYDNGATITADNGPVQIDASTGTNSPLRLNNLSSPPTTSLNTGDVAIIDGSLFAYDNSRTKWLSVNRDKPAFGLRQADGQYLQLTGNFSTNQTGFICHKNSTIVGISSFCDSGNLSKTVKIRKNGSTTDEYSFVMSAGQYLNNSVNIDFSESDIIQVFVESGGSAANNMSVQLEVAYNQ